VPWLILAPSAEASRGVLRRDGFDKADTLSAFFRSREMQEGVRNGLIWLDEASLAGSKSVAQLVDVADRLNARIVLSGDPRQHKCVGRGDVLTLLERDAKLPVAVVSDVQRQRCEYKQAAGLMAAGKVRQGFEKLGSMGWVKKDGLVDDYPHHRQPPGREQGPGGQRLDPDRDGLREERRDRG
jgi:hypothetical protein